MRILIANLKLLCQRPKLWLAYAVLIALLLRFRLTVRSDGIELMDLCCIFFISWPLGAIVGGVMRQMLVKPFTYCLPGHRTMPRQVIFLVGCFWSLILSWLVVDHQGLSILESSVRMAVLSSVALTSYLFGMPFVGRVEAVPSYAVALSFGLFMIWPEIVNALIRRVPGLFVVVGLAVSVVVWRRLRDDTCARAFCAQPLDSFADSHRWSNQKVRRHRRAQSALPTWIESTFITRIDASALSGVARHIWGRLYLAFGRVLEAWRVVLFVVLVVTIYSGYESGTADSEQPGLLGLWVAALVTSFLTTLLPLSMRSSLLLPAGRRERFFGALAVVGVATALVMGVLLFMVVLTGALHSLVPAWFERPDGVGCILFALVLTPGFGIVNLFFSRPLGFQCMAYLGLGMLLALVQMETHFMTVPVLLFASGCMWTVFVLLMHRICMKQSLVAQETPHAFGVHL